MCSYRLSSKIITEMNQKENLFHETILEIGFKSQTIYFTPELSELIVFLSKPGRKVSDISNTFD